MACFCEVSQVDRVLQDKNESQNPSQLYLPNTQQAANQLGAREVFPATRLKTVSSPRALKISRGGLLLHIA